MIRPNHLPNQSLSAAAMAALRYAVFTSPSTILPLYPTGKRVSFKVIRCSSRVSIPLSSSRRKNYLRPKILRTLGPTKPQEIESPPKVPPREEEVVTNKEDDVEELSSAVVSNEVNGVFSKLTPKVVAKYGLCLVGMFAFQTFCAVLFLENSTEKTPQEKSSSRSSNLNGGNEGRDNSDAVVSLEDFEMSEKIAEIRMMAREARRSEEKSGGGDREEDGALNNPGGGVEIEREIEARLSNIERRLNSQRKGLAGLRVEPLEESRDDVKSLMFEKKYKFKGEKPPKGDVKGFGGSKGRNETGHNGSVGDSRDDEDAGPSDSKMISGAAQGSEQRRPSNQVMKSSTSENRKPNTEAGSGFGRSDQHGEVRKGNSTRRVKEKQNKTWWLKLPYVLRILMRSSIDQEVSEGYFTMRTELMEQNKDQVSHMIVFEDQSDATNFSYLLESVFEDLDDFSANVVPISTKDLYNEVSSGGKNVIVVKKRQLKLYAGQPFEDVERALHTLIQEQ
ncbi:ABC subfamily C protein [Hirschfeldia incana]|nr:ABC subfamily C protein [Hirschfeldia incana]